MFVLLAFIALFILFILLVLIQTLTPTSSFESFASITLLSSLALLASIIILLIFDLYSYEDDIPLGKTKEGVMVYHVTEKRQCVEFIRRYLTLTKGLTFPDVKDANELFHLTSVHDVKNDFNTYKIHKVYKPLRPQEGDIIFMNISKWGHVGVVVHVDDENDTVDIVSQNSKDQKWYNYNNNNEGYTERMSLSDPLILGWWKVDEKMENSEYPTTANS